MKKRRIYTAIGILIAYVLLLAALIRAESVSPDAAITSFPKAIWFSFVTLTTVGYGDMFPVTTVGKLICIVFLLLSLGALAALLAFVMTWITGTGLPKMRIRRAAGSTLYIFDSDDSASRALAKNISDEDRNAKCVFSVREGKASFGRNNIFSAALETQDIISAVPENAGTATVIFTGEDADGRYARCDIPAGMNVVCESAYEADEIQTGIRFFDRNDLCASMYWHRYPLGAGEKKIIIIGFGELGIEILEHALESCVFSPVRTVEYHVFGDGTQFMGDHFAIGGSVSIGKESAEKDSLIFHGEAWNTATGLLTEADRIIFCADSDSENADAYRRLKKYFSPSGKVQLYSSAKLGNDLPTFGTDEEIYTPENVLRSGVEKTSRLLHEIYRAGNEGNAPDWENLSAFMRKSNLASAEHIRAKLRFLLEDDSLMEFTPAQMKAAFARFEEIRNSGSDICRRIEHDRWVRFHAMYNWTYAPVRDNAMRRHPMMVSFDELSETDKAKDDYAWDIIGTIADHIDKLN